MLHLKSHSSSTFCHVDSMYKNIKLHPAVFTLILANDGCSRPLPSVSSLSLEPLLSIQTSNLLQFSNPKPNPNFIRIGSMSRRFSSPSSSSPSEIASTSAIQELESPSLGDITRRDFSPLHQAVNGFNRVYFDNAMSSKKPDTVLKALKEHYESYNLNVHRGNHYLSGKATDAYEQARGKVAAFINATSDREIVFTRNATEAINLVAYSWGLSNFKSGDEILLTIAEHHSAITPWQLVAQRTGATLDYVNLNEEVPDVEQLKILLSAKDKTCCDSSYLTYTRRKWRTISTIASSLSQMCGSMVPLPQKLSIVLLFVHSLLTIYLQKLLPIILKNSFLWLLVGAIIALSPSIVS